MEIKQGDVIINVDNEYANTNTEMKCVIEGLACSIRALCYAKSNKQLTYFRKALMKLSGEMISITEEEWREKNER